MLVAGEPSGDALGARLMRALRDIEAEAGRPPPRFGGVGGAEMAGEGLVSRFPLEDLAVMGLSEVVPRLPQLRRRIHETAAAAAAARPDLLVTIDSPDFAFRVARRLKASGAPVPIVHYVAPQVWAWRPGRARAMAGFLDGLLALLPFEPPLFEAAGLPCRFVGHPVVEAAHGDGAAFRAAHGIAPQTPLLAVLPGSRSGEARRLLPVFGAALALLRARLPRFAVVTAALPGTAADLRQAAAGWPVPVHVVTGAQKCHAFAAADAALAASGTVTLELARAGVPLAVAYRLHPLSAMLARRLLRVPAVNLMNLLLNERVFPELLQEDCTPGRLAETAHLLLTDEALRARQREAGAAALRQLEAGAEAPSRCAARALRQAALRPAPLPGASAHPIWEG